MKDLYEVARFKSVSVELTFNADEIEKALISPNSFAKNSDKNIKEHVKNALKV